MIPRYILHSRKGSLVHCLGKAHLSIAISIVGWMAVVFLLNLDVIIFIYLMILNFSSFVIISCAGLAVFVGIQYHLSDSELFIWHCLPDSIMADIFVLMSCAIYIVLDNISPFTLFFHLYSIVNLCAISQRLLVCYILHWCQCFLASGIDQSTLVVFKDIFYRFAVRLLPYQF